MSALRIRSVAALALGFSAVGCYTHTPLEQDVEPRGSMIRAEVMGETWGETRGVRGEMVEWRDEEELLLILRPSPESMTQAQLSAFDDAGHRSFGDTLAIRADRLVAVERRELSAGRTGALVGGAAVAVGFGLYWLFSEWAGGTEYDGPEGPPNVSDDRPIPAF